MTRSARGETVADSQLDSFIRAYGALGTERLEQLTGLPAAFWDQVSRTLQADLCAALDSRINELGMQVLAERAGLPYDLVLRWFDQCEDGAFNNPRPPPALADVLDRAEVRAAVAGCPVACIPESYRSSSRRARGLADQQQHTRRRGQVLNDQHSSLGRLQTRTDSL